MALFKSATMTSASGSVGGATYSHNRFGLYLRARRVPVNPNSTFQQTVRNSFSSASAAWRALTAEQRAAWEAYAAATPVTNAMGDTIHLTGSQQHLATNALALTLGLAAITAAPTTPGRIAIGALQPTISVAGVDITVTGVSAPDTATLAVFAGDVQSAGVSFFAGPYQLRGFDQPALGILTVGSFAGRNGVPLVLGQRMPIRIAGIGVDGRLTTVWQQIVTVSA